MRVVLTYKDYEALPDNGRRYEIHDGEISVTPAPTLLHQETLGNLYVILRQHVERHRLGKIFIAPVDVILADVTVVQPDLVFVANDRLSLLAAGGVEGSPAFVVEVVSTFKPEIDRQTKLQLYARYGVPYYWIVDPHVRSAEAYQFAGDSYALTARRDGDESLSAPPFPDLIVPLASVWPQTLA